MALFEPSFPDIEDPQDKVPDPEETEGFGACRNIRADITENDLDAAFAMLAPQYAGHYCLKLRC